MFCCSCGSKNDDAAEKCQSCGVVFEKEKEKEKSKLIIRIKRSTLKWISVVLVALVLLLSFSGLRGNVHSSPEKVINSFFRSIEKVDVDKIIDLMPPGSLEDILAYERMSSREFKRMFREEIEDLSDYARENWGRNWSSKVNIIEINDTNHYVYVRLEIEGNRTNIQLIKIDGKYYIDMDSFF